MSEKSSKDGWNFKIAKKIKNNDEDSNILDVRKRIQKDHKLKLEKSEVNSQTRSQRLLGETSESGTLEGPISSDIKTSALKIDLFVYSIGVILLLITEEHYQNHLNFVPAEVWDYKLLVFLLTTHLFVLTPFTVIFMSTPGQLSKGVKIGHLEGGFATRSSLILRETVGKLISLLTVIGVVLYFSGRRPFHDMLAGTKLVHKNIL